MLGIVNASFQMLGISGTLDALLANRTEHKFQLYFYIPSWFIFFPLSDV